MKCPVCRENFVIRYSLEAHILKEHCQTQDRKDPEFVRLMMSLPPPKNASPKPTNESLAGFGTAQLAVELIARGCELVDMGDDLKDTHDEIMKAFAKQDEHTIKTKEYITRETESALSQLKGIVATAEQQLNTTAESVRIDCEKMTTVSINRSNAAEQQCVESVKEAQEACQKAIEAVTTECNRRVEAAEAEALRCIEEADKATAAANAAGATCNALSERLHNIEISIRTLFSGGMAQAPVYTPAPTLAVAPPVPAPAPVAPAPAPPPPPKRNGTHPRMEFVLLGLHQKNIQNILHALRKPTARGVDLIVVEDTSKEILPKSVDYAIVSGHSALGLRWKWCLENYGPSKCVRLDNGSLAAFRDKIEQLFEAKFPNLFVASNAPINSVGVALVEAAKHAA